MPILKQYKKHALWACFLMLISSTVTLPVFAQPQVDIGAPQATISIIIDDIGYRLKEGEEVINLEGALTYAVLPHTPHTRFLANLANKQGKEVMVHLPMQAEIETSEEQGLLTLDMTHAEFVEAFNKSIIDVPHAIGVNNHQGSLLTRHPGHMAWVMTEIKKTGNLFFIDSRTSRQSVAEMVAREHHVPVLHRDIFLDHDKNKESIRTQFKQLIRLAKKRGSAIGIGHPYPETLEVLREMLPQLNDMGVNLIPVSAQFKTNSLKQQLAIASTN